MNSLDALIDTAADTEVVSRSASALQRQLQPLGKTGAMARKVEDLLHGVPLGHPVHSVLTDLTIGLYTSTFFLDLLELFDTNEERASISDGFLLGGLLSAVPTIITGVADWKDSEGRTRNLGLIHAALNATANLCYLGAYVSRKRSRGVRLALAFAGATVMTAAAYLGGRMVYREKFGANHSQPPLRLETWTPVLPVQELEDNTPHRVVIHNFKVLLYKEDDVIYATQEVCPHFGGPLSEGKVHSLTVTCPWHQSVFDLQDGSVIHGPSCYPLQTFEVSVLDNMVCIRTTRK